MEKTLAMHLEDLREEIAMKIKDEPYVSSPNCCASVNKTLLENYLSIIKGKK